MNKLTIIGNLTKDPELRTVSRNEPVSVCSFTVAVNRRSGEADFFRVTAWRGLAENCAKFLSKGRKVCVIGPVTATTYQAQDGSSRVSLEVTADEVEFLSPKSEENGDAYEPEQPKLKQRQKPMTAVDDDLPWM